MPSSNLPPHDFLDSIIAINIILFIISVIVEKITQLIRKYAPFIKTYGSGRRLKIWQNIGKKQTGRAKELDKLIEREVNSLSFIIGLVIAAAFRIDLFKMISSSDPQAVLMWKDIPYSLLDKILFFLSLPLTAFFLTFGSKFFHDLLDTLFQVKNLKRKLVDPNTFEADNIEEFDDFLKQNYHDIIEAAISQNSNLFNVPGLLYAPLQGKMIKNGNLIDCIEVHLSTAGPGSIPSNVKARLDTGRTVSVPVNVLTDISAPTAHGGQGGVVAAGATPGFTGSLCCKLNRNDNPEFMTCAHIYTGGPFVQLNGENTLKPALTDGQLDGNFHYSLFDDEFDLALYTPDDQNLNYVIQPKTPRAINSSDVRTTEIRIVCRGGRITRGKITKERASNPVPITYGRLPAHSLNGLMMLSSYTDVNDINTYSSLTRQGDSGSCVYDDQDRPIGMVVAGNNRFTYAIPMSTILNKLSATIIS